MGLFVAATLALVEPACKDGRKTAAATSEKKVQEHVAIAAKTIKNSLDSMLPALREAAKIKLLAPAMAGGPAKEDDVRIELTDMSRPGGKLGIAAFGFVAAVGLDGKVIARDKPKDEDKLKGFNLAVPFSAVQQALQGGEANEVGEFPAVDGYPSSVISVAAVPVRDATGKVVGALAAGRSFGRLAVLAKTYIEVETKKDPVIWVGLLRNGRLFPSGDDSDVMEINLIPKPLVDAVPKDIETRTANPGQTATWTFMESARGWAGVAANLPELQGTRIVIYRSESSQN
jgi:hypothetical protein